jgi:hypothetical protein
MQIQQGVHQRNAAVARYPEYRAARLVNTVSVAQIIVKLAHDIYQPFCFPLYRVGTAL